MSKLVSPFGELGSTLSDSELRETAYEIFVGACRSSTGRPLTYISQSDRAVDRSSSSLSAAPSLQRSLTSTAASKVKGALGLKKKNPDSVNSAKSKRPGSVAELVRVQMRVSEQSDSRIRRALLRIAAGQLGRRIESIVLPLELLRQLKPSDFPSQQEYESWQKRNLKVLEAGLVLHPYLPLGKTDRSSQQLQQIIHRALDKPIETGNNSQPLQSLQNIVMSLACRMFDGSVSDTCHWADGYPLNLKLYQLLLEACFDVNDPTSVIEEIDDVLELIKKTWVILGVNQMMHNLCFAWALFRHYVETRQVENDLLFAADNLMMEVATDTKATRDPIYPKILSSVLNSILGWAEPKLLAYHEAFYNGNVDSMQGVVSLGVSAAMMLVEGMSDEYRGKRKEVDVAHERIDYYIRSSMRKAFAQVLEKASFSRQKKRQFSLPALTSLAQEIRELAFNEKEIFSPTLSRWHPLAAGVAAATLHACYGNELKKFIAGIEELTPDAVHVLIAADKLEKDLVKIAVEDSVDSEDGGKGIIQEMPPYEADAVIVSLAKSWIRSRVDRMKEWVDRNLQQEAWNLQANKEGIAPSAVEVLQTIDETLEAFFLLPIPSHAVLLPDLVNGLDGCLRHYILKAKSGCGTRSSFLPAMPNLTRCTTGSKFRTVFKKEKSQITQRRKSQVGNTNTYNSSELLQLCVRINTLQHIRKVLGGLQRKTMTHLQNSGYQIDDVSSGSGKKFDLSAAACQEGIQQLCEATAYKVVFLDLSHILWDTLYVGGVSYFRIEPFLQELEQKLEIISTAVHDRARTRVITDTMTASFDGFLLVLLAGGPSRAFAQQDSVVIEEDFKSLADLFWSNGDGLPEDLIDKLSSQVKGVLRLFNTETETLIEQFKSATLESNGSSTKSRLPLPPTSGHWSPFEPNTLLRVLCHRYDEKATKFLKKTYNLPKKL